MSYMSKLIDADRLKDYGITILLSCPKCHGTGKHYFSNGYNPSDIRFAMLEEDCYECRGTGKVTVGRYEEIQKAGREK